MKSSKRSSGKKTLRKMMILLSLCLFGINLSGCFGQKVVVLPDSKEMSTHPTDKTKMCIDKGYLNEIYLTCGVNNAESPTEEDE